MLAAVGQPRRVVRRRRYAGSTQIVSYVGAAVTSSSASPWALKAAMWNVRPIRSRDVQHHDRFGGADRLDPEAADPHGDLTRPLERAEHGAARRAGEAVRVGVCAQRAERAEQSRAARIADVEDERAPGLERTGEELARRHLVLDVARAAAAPCGQRASIVGAGEARNRVCGERVRCDEALDAVDGMCVDR
ncbi:hypothetical protein [Roseisolibacter sp. H3M3-2]|uniref:hypothetical protein n=1 Tax=Roseisolibacter sp. H3M3-2 TaxID=3031323 RepID=UPI0023DBAF7C|nr:hypothetical protein [Roseisolibacter sp. H3M3-2]MDF1501828.1 hypothetical protein [Roseisolibacter sp. H3M3-2]